jgi:hypothetical protein
MDGCRRPAKLGQMWPKRSRSPGRFGGLGVSCWATGPSGCKDSYRGPYSLAGLINSEFCELFYSVSEAYLNEILNEFCIVLISTQIEPTRFLLGDQKSDMLLLNSTLFHELYSCFPLQKFKVLLLLILI